MGSVPCLKPSGMEEIDLVPCLKPSGMDIIGSVPCLKPSGMENVGSVPCLKPSGMEAMRSVPCLKPFGRLSSKCSSTRTQPAPLLWTGISTGGETTACSFDQIFMFKSYRYLPLVLSCFLFRSPSSNQCLSISAETSATSGRVATGV